MWQFRNRKKNNTWGTIREGSMVEVIHWALKEGVPMGRAVESMVGAR